MKSEKFVIALAVGLALQQLALAQTNNQSTDAAANGAVAETTVTNTSDSNVTVNVNVTVTNAPSEAAVSNAPAASSNETVTAAETNSSTTSSNGEMTIISSNAPTASSMTESNAPAGTNQMASATGTNAPVEPIIPLIQFQDVPITTAIENLARQAGINYLLDPRVTAGYNQPDQNGQVKPEPQLSIRWENITARQALLALLDNYGLQLVQDKRSKIARITIKDPSAPPPLSTKVVQLKYASVSNMVIAVQSVLTDKRSRVLPDVRTSQMVVVATDNEQDAVASLVTQLDKPTRQVLIETHLVEISSNPSTSKGVDWSGTLAGQNISFGNNATAATAATNATAATLGGILNSGPGVLASTAGGFNPSTFFLNADGVKAVLSFLNKDSDAQVISTPRVVTLDNESANISVTRAFPVFNTTAGTQGSPGGSTIGYTNVGTTLDVTPRISANDYIWLKVVPQVSSLFGKDTETIAGSTFSADIFDYRAITTQVLIPNANTLVMGGLVKDNPQSTYTKVPIMGDIPILGYAFRSENKSLDKDNLLIFITPTILQDNDFTPTKTDFLKTKANRPPNPVDPNNPWEGAKPYDWSNPQNTDNYQPVLNQNP